MDKLLTIHSARDDRIVGSCYIQEFIGLMDPVQTLRETRKVVSLHLIIGSFIIQIFFLHNMEASEQREEITTQKIKNKSKTCGRSIRAKVVRHKVIFAHPSRRALLVCVLIFTCLLFSIQLEGPRGRD